MCVSSSNPLLFSVENEASGAWSSYSRHFGLPGPTGAPGAAFGLGPNNQTAQNSLLQLAGLQGLEKWQ